jgi:MFS transporter, ACS family, hexuronate transporter
VNNLLGANRAALTGKEWRVLGLLVISGFLNYVDRANLSVGATNIQAELHLTNYHLGKLLSVFFWTYATFQLFGIATGPRFSVPFFGKG